ncbi:MAG: hypothetical protein M3Y13_02925 [Armatimonadota bacterium]|nr:hypothetical protein [Armatimonadota bacterium]
MLPTGAQTPASGHFVIPRAVRLDLRHTGIHTHANFVMFNTGSHDLAAMQRDPARYPHLTIRAETRLDTDHAALPPDLTMPGDPPLDNPYGPIGGGHGKPGWSVMPLAKNGRHLVKVSVPTRFANWLALQPAARRKRYLDPRQYQLEVRWGGYNSLANH